MEKSRLTHNNVQEDILNQAKYLIPILVAPLAEGFKYLGFQLKPNVYSFQHWTASKKAEGIPLVKWTTIVLPKSKGGWGIKNPDLFCKALAAKCLWRMVENLDSLWGRTMRVKYCPLLNRGMVQATG